MASAFRAANAWSSHPFPSRSEKPFLPPSPILRTLLCAHYKLVQQPRCRVPPQPLTLEAEVSPTWWSCCYGLHSRLYHWAALAVPTCKKKRQNLLRQLVLAGAGLPGACPHHSRAAGESSTPRKSWGEPEAEETAPALPSERQQSGSAGTSSGDPAASVSAGWRESEYRFTQDQETSQAPSSALAHTQTAPGRLPARVP